MTLSIEQQALSTEEYTDKERYEPNGGQEIKKWKRLYTRRISKKA